MKTKITLLVFLWLSLYINSQGTLQFNQAKLLEGSLANCPVCWTVPAGKVWKVSSFSSSSGSQLNYHVNNRQLGFFALSGGTNDARYANPFPFWLPAGATFGYTGMSNGQAITFFALEFNVIP